MINLQKSGTTLGVCAPLSVTKQTNLLMQKESQNLKFSIESRLNKLPGTKRSNAYKLCIELDIALNTLYRWMALKKESRSSIPTDKFYLIASFLDCNPIDLINE